MILNPYIDNNRLPKTALNILLKRFLNQDHLQVQGVFGAGFDTFSVLSRWMFIYIGIFPEQAEKARNEVDEFIEKNQHFPRFAYIAVTLYLM